VAITIWLTNKTMRMVPERPPAAEEYIRPGSFQRNLSKRVCDHRPSKEISMYDMTNLGKLKTLDANAPAAMQAFWAFDKAAMAAGAIPLKYKELMALAVAFTTQCPYCIEVHAKRARESGASEPEIAEVVAVAAALRAGAAITHGTHAMA
jgi:AhpD family alkylhydroperoxidase